MSKDIKSFQDNIRRTFILFSPVFSSSGLFREMLAERLKKQRSGLCVHFGRAELSGDNAVGVALLGADRVRASLSGGS